MEQAGGQVPDPHPARCRSPDSPGRQPGWVPPGWRHLRNVVQLFGCCIMAALASCGRGDVSGLQLIEVVDPGSCQQLGRLADEFVVVLPEAGLFGPYLRLGLGERPWVPGPKAVAGSLARATTQLGVLQRGASISRAHGRWPWHRYTRSIGQHVPCALPVLDGIFPSPGELGPSRRGCDRRGQRERDDASNVLVHSPV